MTLKEINCSSIFIQRQSLANIPDIDLFTIYNLILYTNKPTICIIILKPKFPKYMHSIPHYFLSKYVIILLHIFHRYHTNEIELLIHILRCFTSRFIVHFQFVKYFLDNVVAEVRDIQLHFTIYVLSSPETKAQVSFSDQNLSVVRRYPRR